MSLDSGMHWSQVILWWQVKKGINSELEGANTRRVLNILSKRSLYIMRSSHTSAHLQKKSTCFSSWTSPHSHLSQMLEPPCHLQDSCACHWQIWSKTLLQSQQWQWGIWLEVGTTGKTAGVKGLDTSWSTCTQLSLRLCPREIQPIRRNLHLFKPGTMWACLSVVWACQSWTYRAKEWCWARSAQVLCGHAQVLCGHAQVLCGHSSYQASTKGMRTTHASVSSLQVTTKY